MDLLFVISSVVAVFGAVVLITQKNAVYALLGLLISFGASAGIFLALESPFIAVSQILIYAGALAVMFLFVLMFTDTRTDEDEGKPATIGARPDFDPTQHSEKKKGKKDVEPNKLLAGIMVPKPMAVVVSLALLACMSFAIIKLPASYSKFGDLPTVEQTATKEASDSSGAPNYDTGLTWAPKKSENGEKPVQEKRLVAYGSPSAISFTIFEGFPLAFEVVSLLIFAAILGAVLLARRHLAGIPGTQDAIVEDDGEGPEHA